jgi:hypothetical protein
MKEPHFYFDQDGNPISVLEWGAEFENFKNRIVAETAIANITIITIITMWLGIVIPGRCRLFGTAALDEIGGVITEIAQWDTKDDALTGHADIVTQLAANAKTADLRPALHDLLDKLARRTVD